MRGAEPIEFNVLASRYPEERRTWVAITTDDRTFEISQDTAVELHTALGELLGTLAVRG